MPLITATTPGGVLTPTPVPAPEPRRTLGTMTPAKLTLLVGSTLTMIGMVLGLMPHSELTDGNVFGVTSSCGSGFAPNPNILYTTQCIADTDAARTMALALLIPGLVLLAVVGALAVYRWQMARDAAEQEHVTV